MLATFIIGLTFYGVFLTIYSVHIFKVRFAVHVRVWGVVQLSVTVCTFDEMDLYMYLYAYEYKHIGTCTIPFHQNTHYEMSQGP